MVCHTLIASNLLEEETDYYFDREALELDAQSLHDLEMDEYRWAAMFYYGRMTSDILLKLLRFDNHVLKGGRRADLYSLELAYQLKHENLFRRIFQPILSTIDVAMNVTYQNDPVGNIYEFNPYIRFVWQNFPWSEYINTILALGEGVSYATRIQNQDLMNRDLINQRKRFLNFLMFEAGVSLPQYPQWEIYYRLHHRSGVFGLYSRRQGTTAMGVAIRYHFS